MRNLFGGLILLLIVARPATAQTAWRTEIGIQGGYTRVVVPGQGGPVDGVGLPGLNLGPALPFPAAVYAIIPWKPKLALEVDAAGSQLSGAVPATLFAIGLRADYAIAEQFYLAGGGSVGYINSGNAGFSETQLGLQAGVGYRRRLSSVLNGRVEARVAFWGKTENVGPRDVYSVLVGVSKTTGRGGSAGRAPRAARAWTPQLGISAGYANLHAVGDPNDLTILAFPTFGAGVGALGAAPGGPPTLFAILPVGRKIAIEPGVDIHRFQSNGTTQLFANLSARLNYALTGRWYGALGGGMNYITNTGADAATVTGLHTALGYRFGISGLVNGRVELNYTMYGKNEDLGIPPVNVMGVTFGAMVPLK